MDIEGIDMSRIKIMRINNLNRIIIFLIIIGVTMGIGCEPSSKYHGTAKILISPGPFSYPMMEARFLFLVDYLSQETGWKLDKVSAPTAEMAFIKMVKTEKIDLAIVNPYLYLLLEKEKGAIPILQTVSFDGRNNYRGMVICRQDSPIKLLTDLRGKQILAPSRTTVGGFISQWVLLKEHGLDPDREVTYHYGITQEEIIEKIMSGRAEVGFIREDVYEAIKKANGHAPKVKVLAYTPYYPNPCVVVFPDTNPELIEKVKSALLKLKQDDP
ncbi:MAG: phosphate/phosphite/phosphonate ABC transporter substrate-binding protein, partial [Desulfobacterota bacterium]|nr:phosphate/phosphite/phosphonate ABC transporter substrate-binding protein [Thermodesulfobacteriota bacterium]